MNGSSFVKQLLAALIIATLMPWPAHPQAQPASVQSENSSYKIKVTTEIVLVNVVARDKQGNFVKDLRAEDFTVQEDGKTQKIESFDREQIEVTPALANASEPTVTGTIGAAPQPAAPTTDQLRNKRLIVMFFDLSGMQPDETERSLKTAQEYLDKRMTAADLISIVSLGTNLRVEQDFTNDKALLSKALNRLNPLSSGGFDAGSTGDTESTPDTAGSFTADDTEFNIFNTDRKLQALKAVSANLAKIEQKKSLILFGSGVSQTGIENQTELRAAINEAVKANVAIYTVDIRGLQALPPGGDATTASLRGVGMYSGQAVRNQFDTQFQTQETLYTVAHDTGGQAFLDSNDFGKVFDRVQQDTSSYYVIGYRSTNPARDGRYRKIAVRTNRKDIKLEYRAGYYAPADFQHTNRDDREAQLQEQLASDLPSTDLGVYLTAAYFRLADGRFFVPVSIVVPGSAIPFTSSSDKEKATLDVIGLVRESATKIPLGNVRDTVKLAVNESQQVRRKNVQYNTGFTLPPGSYHLKFVVRENQTGRMGSFETDLVIPDFKKAPLKMSSVVLGNQLQQSSKKKSDNPLVRDGNELLPNVAHVFTSNQTLYFYYEVYDPGKQSKDTAPKDAPKGAIRLLTNVSFFNGKVKAFETPLVEATQLNAPERKAAAFEFQVPLSKLRPGLYTCQVNVVDDAGGAFAFPRLALLVREAPTTTAQTQTTQ